MSTMIPTCCIDDCDTEVPGLDDGRDAHDRDGIACTDCWAYYDRHHHWPDEDREPCSECLIDEGAVRHECDEFEGDAVILDLGSECPYCPFTAAEEEEVIADA